MDRLTALRRLVRNRRLSAVILAAALSAFGDWLYLAALPMVVYRSTGDPTLLGIAAAGRLLPFFLLSVPAGVIADRFDRRRVVIVAESIRAALMAAMAIVVAVDGGAVTLIVLATVSAAFGTIAMPAQMALVPELAADDELGLANAASMTLDHAAGVVAPLAAAILVAAAGLAPACIVNALSFAIVVAAMIGIGGVRRPATPGANGAAAPDAGPAAAAENDERPPTLVANRGLIAEAAPVLTLDAAISFAAGAFSVLPVLVAVRSLGGGEELAGVMNAAAGAGAMLGGVAAGIVVGRGEGRSIRLGIVAAVIGLAAVAVPSLPVVVAASVVTVTALGMLDTLNVTRLQTTLPGASHGRGIGILHTSAAAWLIAGSAIPPIVAGVASVETALGVTAAVVAMLGCISIALDPRGGRRATDSASAAATSRAAGHTLTELPA